MSKEVRLFINTKPHKRLLIKNEINVIYIDVCESGPVMPCGGMMASCFCKKFTASIKKDKDGYYAEIFSEELYFSEEGELHYKPQDKKK